MRFSQEFRDRALVEEIASRLSKTARATIMEVCGTHTMSAARFGLRSLLPPGVKLVSGPGCPVCVTDQHDIDCFLALGNVPGVVLATFGDMLRVPGSFTTLEKLRATGADVRVVYSPMDALEIARGAPQAEVVFFGVGFETTMPATALAVRSAAEAGLANFSVFSVHKTMPPGLRALLSAQAMRVSGLLLPGHVTTIIGARAYDFIPREFGMPCAVAGFEPVDMMLGIESLLRQIESGKPIVDNVYPRAVGSEPNKQAADLIADVFSPADAAWRGIGIIPESGARIAQAYGRFDARQRFAEVLSSVAPPAQTDCRCGDVLRASLAPADCPLFGSECTPTYPAGPCMVSSEGACAAAYRY